MAAAGFKPVQEFDGLSGQVVRGLRQVVRDRPGPLDACTAARFLLVPSPAPRDPRARAWRVSAFQRNPRSAQSRRQRAQPRRRTPADCRRSRGAARCTRRSWTTSPAGCPLLRDDPREGPAGAGLDLRGAQARSPSSSPGTCRRCGRDLIRVTKAESFTCPVHHTSIDTLDPGKCPRCKRTLIAKSTDAAARRSQSEARRIFLHGVEQLAPGSDSSGSVGLPPLHLRQLLEAVFAARAGRADHRGRGRARASGPTSPIPVHEHARGVLRSGCRTWPPRHHCRQGALRGRTTRNTGSISSFRSIERANNPARALSGAFAT